MVCGTIFCSFACANASAKIDAGDLFGDGMVDPALFDERDEQGAGLLEGAQAVGGAGAGVGVALHGGFGGEDEHAVGGEVGGGGFAHGRL